MAKELLIYNGIFSFTAADFITQLNEAAGEDITVRINTPGGEPEYGWGMIAKLQEHTGKKTVKIDGKAYSMGAFIAAYADEVIALDVSQFLLHRAAYPSWYEEDYMTDELWENLNNINTSLRKALEAKIDVKKLEEMKGVKFADLWDNNQRKDVFLTAKEAKAIGLIDKIVKITPAKKAEIDTTMARIAAQYQLPAAAAAEEEEMEDAPPASPSITVNKQPMTLEKFKQEHPEIYAQAEKAGAEKERIRVGAWMAWDEIDTAAVKAGIESGKEITAKDTAEFQRKALSADNIKKLQAESTPPVTTDKPDEKETKPEDAAMAVWTQGWRKHAGLTEPAKN